MDYVEKNIKILTKHGERHVAAITHPACRGLAVAMPTFGLFTVVHVPTGMAIAGRYESCFAALLYMVRFAQIAKTNTFNWSELKTPQEAQDKTTEIDDKPVPFDGYTVRSINGERVMTIREWYKLRRDEEFEYLDDLSLADEIIEKELK